MNNAYRNHIFNINCPSCVFWINQLLRASIAPIVIWKMFFNVPAIPYSIVAKNSSNFFLHPYTSFKNRRVFSNCFEQPFFIPCVNLRLNRPCISKLSCIIRRASRLDKRCICLTHGKRSAKEPLAIEFFVLDQTETRDVSIEDVEILLDAISISRAYVNVADTNSFEIFALKFLHLVVDLLILRSFITRCIFLARSIDKEKNPVICLCV